ncbi:MAG: HAMP domain-containing sensor histidine kinase [Thermomicrobiales bacterium]
MVERPDGVQVAVVASTVPLRDGAGELREIVSIYQELTDQAHAQLVRDEVLSIASHELRTPLTVILGYSSLLRSLPSTQQDARTQRALTKIYEQSLRMRDLIEHLLDFSRIALGRIQLQWIAFDLNTLVREVGERQQSEAGPRPLRLALPDEPLAMTGDYGRLAQALQQVIRAAWQQSSQGEVVVSLHTGTPASFRTLGMALPTETERRYALIHVGQGAATPVPGNGAHLSTIDNVSPDKALELTVSAELVRLHGGALLVEPQPSQGSAFSLLLPLQEGSAV